ncbi:MAG TPA: serine/threonine-protein kinase [Polyangia bacterium]|nr:serine/threonine-protein kinase [Polyangia bacterium]
MPAAPNRDCIDENAVLGFLEGALSSTAQDRIQAHLSVCRACLALITAAARSNPARSITVASDYGAQVEAALPSRGSSVGRYAILNLVGQGGMGEVYAAYDPELDRRVALKLLTEERSAGVRAEVAQARLLREAKAIARLSHPNVVVVHDAGTIDGRVFIAMEFLRGRTLKAWLDSQPRTWSEIRTVFIAAGRGLMAAHAAGLVHRDVKPQNVMVDDDGTVRVTDFGLASEDLAPGIAAQEGAAHATANSVDAPTPAPPHLTRTGAVMGTPLYMAPEQFCGEKTDPRTDQFSFCVMLYEALYGERPFPSDSLPQLREAVIEGKVREPAQRNRVPARLRRILLRGLSRNPDDRYPSMTALLAELERDAGRQRRRLAVGAVVAMSLLALGAVVQRATNRPAVLCRGGGEKLNGIWELASDGSSASRRAASKRAFLATGSSYASTSWEHAARLLDDYARRWAQMFNDSCAATHITGEQSSQVLDLRTDCLDEALNSLRAVSDLFASADGEVVTGAVNAASGLSQINRCADVRLLRAIVKPPSTPEQQVRVDQLRRRAAAVRALIDTGKMHEALTQAGVLANDAQAVRYDPLESEAFLLLGLVQGFTGAPNDAVRSFHRALPIAVASRDDQLAAELTATMAGMMGFELDREKEGISWADLSDAFASRIGPSADRAHAWSLQARANIYVLQERYPEGVGAYLQAIALKQKIAGGESVDAAHSYGSMSLALAGMGDFEAAVAATTTAIEILERQAGTDSPSLGAPLNNRGETLNQLGRPAEALSSFRRAMQIWMGTAPDDSPWFAYALTGEGESYLLLGRPGEAIGPLERALAIREKSDPAPQRLGETRFALARALLSDGRDRRRARLLATTARDDYARHSAPSTQKKLREIDAWLAAHGFGKIADRQAGPTR